MHYDEEEPPMMLKKSDGATLYATVEGIPPFGCPFAALTIALAEKNLGKRARLEARRPRRPGRSRNRTTGGPIR